jgi:hypothetical protein
MSVLGRPEGFFDLKTSDVSVGSMLSKDDLRVILGASDAQLDCIPFKSINGLLVADERDVQKLWYSGRLTGKIPNKIGGASISFDELIVAALILEAFPGAKVEHQIKWGRKRIDLKFEHNGTVKLIEFCGPSHFAPSQFRDVPESPLTRKDQVERDFSVECIIWPYWIQRCRTNVQAIHEVDKKGFGVLWSTNCHFGHFVGEEAAAMIEQISDRFGARRDSGFGYFYGPDTESRRNPEHPIIRKIASGKVPLATIVPRGCKDVAEWVPKRLLE